MGQGAYDLVDGLGIRSQVNHLWHVTRNVYIELQALEASQADKYLIFAGKLPCRVRFKNGFRLA
jgi:hypothetical protein